MNWQLLLSQISHIMIEYFRFFKVKKFNKIVPCGYGNTVFLMDWNTVSVDKKCSVSLFSKLASVCP